MKRARPLFLRRRVLPIAMIRYMIRRQENAHDKDGALVLRLPDSIAASRLPLLPDLSFSYISLT